MTERTIPDRDTIARALFTWDTDENPHPPTWGELTNNQRDVWRSGADAMLALLADQPTIAEARAQALQDAADAVDDWDDAIEDVSAMLRTLAARERGESR